MSAVAIAACGCAAVLVLDAVGGFLSRRFGFDYRWLAPGSLLVYAVTGYLAADAGGHFLVGAAATAAAGATDATVGWRISNAIGASEEVPPDIEMTTATMVTLFAAGVGAGAGLFA